MRFVDPGEVFNELARIITQNLARRVLHLISLVEDLSLRTVEARLARVLLEQSTEGVLHRRRWTTQALARLAASVLKA